MDLYGALRPLIFRLDPETAHNLTFWMGARACAWPWLPKPALPASLRCQALGLSFPTPLGLAAGLDKGATLLPLWKSLGFGHVEVGTVTPRPQPGNPKPRIFRFPEAGLILNRMGFNSEGAEVVAARLRRRPAGLVVGGNLGKNKETPEADALNDYRAAYRLIAPQVDYIALNVSSPNTPGLRNLQAPEALKPLLAGMLDLRKEMGLERQPLLLKLAPDLAPEDLDAIVEVAVAAGISGLIATNTTLDRGVVQEPLRAFVESKGAGGLSGVPLKDKARQVRQRILAALAGRLPLVACGGLGSAADVQGALDDGAALAQVYSALIFEGPSLVGRIHQGLAEHPRSH
ncbi:quinone-dependent dihydroorotate dehydrogenase [Geothrix sp. PMB-07]|uniref:quinone-dependent dihydroorotate dehydrogenase n=1 Tax=Geothrix sp. PMB-07 TaxID=3068640 RepID=UPI002741D984|nr:quinone-dependent dihydroorotate dehydrogenase [Geothrix sp. PMB-07]WLT33229.1 quinone-dependent dihydroorotate dehydrogenase [Geothrix sp. PMB-07]